MENKKIGSFVLETGNYTFDGDFLCDFSKIDSLIGEVKEVVHASWIVKGQDIFCSNCDGESGYNAWGASSFSAYCPNCGAMMDGERREEK